VVKILVDTESMIEAFGLEEQNHGGFFVVGSFDMVHHQINGAEK
jgi:hypothetical protein